MNLYAWFWYHTEFWIKDKSLRRPYTFIMRDFYHQHAILTIFIEAWAVYLFNYFVHELWQVWIGVSIGCLLGHLFWGKKWVPGEQENPTYPGGK